MNRIEKMVKEMCPGGVEKVKLGEISDITNGERPPKNIEDGIFPYINAGTIPSGYLPVYNSDENAITTPSHGEGGIGFVDFQPRKFWCGALCFKIYAKENKVYPKYLYYSLSQNNDQILALKKEGGVPYFNKKQLENISIPLPPLSIQQEIVNILDNFTALQQNLEDELKLRQKQYEHYREKLLTFEEGECEWKKLSDICEVINGRAYKQSELLDKGPYRVLRVGNFFSNDSWYYSDLQLEDKYYCVKGDLLYAWSASFGPHIWDEEKVIYHYHIWKLECTKDIDKKFFFYWLQSENMTSQVSSEKHGATMAHLTKALMERLIVPIPSKDKQHQIVSTLSHFELLISNLRHELSLRQKQYEYYREKLLTF